MKIWKCRSCGHYFFSNNPHELLAGHMRAAHHEIPFIVEADFDLFRSEESVSYINFKFSEMKWSDRIYEGLFEASDYGVRCRFRYDRETGDYEFWEVRTQDDTLLPLPIFWLDDWLEEHGNLDGNVSRICF